MNDEIVEKGNWRRIFCRLLGGHRFDGWIFQKNYRPGFPLPMAYCQRCGGEL